TCGRGRARSDPGARRRGLSERERRRAPAARREALHDRCRDERDPPDADRTRAHRPRPMTASHPEVWRPTPEQVEAANVTRLMHAEGVDRFDDLVARSIADPT